MDDLVDTVNRLQDIFNVSGYKNVDLPQVVVLGSQSSGKSSVLEHLVGKSFLPRGSGIVTRCPLVLQLTKSQGEEYAVFQHDYTKVFTDYTLICQEIERQTDRLAGSNKGICATPITLKLFSPSNLNLTLVDLPGLTKVPVGDQPADIDEQTRCLAMEYVNNPNSLILTVIPANADMATSESLKISRDVDPEGTRTLAVVTKLDIMDAGTTATDMLNGQVIPVKLGIIGVVNRSQKDITKGKSIEESLNDEAAFFHKKYECIASQHGTIYLKKTVQRILINHIKRCLPELKDNISKQLATRRSELSLIEESNMDKPSQMVDLINKFSRHYCSTIKGDLHNIETGELCGGARINYVFQDTLCKALKTIDALTDLLEASILTAVQNAAGASTHLFVPQVAFELIMKRQLRNLRNPCMMCVNLIYQELDNIRQSCLQDPELGLARYPKLEQEISTVVHDLLDGRISVTNSMVKNLIDVQLAHINTAHPDLFPNKLLNRSTSLNEQIEKLTENHTRRYPIFHGKEPIIETLIKDILYDINDSEEIQLSFFASPTKDKDSNCYIFIKTLIKRYFNIVRLSLHDIIPKVIMHFMVNYVMDNLHSQLIGKLYGRNAADLLEESPEVIAKRTGLERAINTLKSANKVLRSLNSPSKEVNSECVL